MERQARARFLVFRVSRLSLALLLLALLALLLYPARGFMPVAVLAPSNPTIRQGVVMLGRDFSGRTEAEARAMLAEMAALLEAVPVAAREQKEADGVSYVVPELNGHSLDIDSTIFRLTMAAEGTRVEPATRIQTPAKRLGDYPVAVIRRGNPEKSAVSLLINVDWGTEELKQMLPILKARGVRTTFFVSGKWAEKNRELLKAMADEGHEVASHGHDLSSGPSDLARAGRLKADIEQSVRVIEAATGRKVRYFAPHMSEISPEIVRTAADLNLRTVLYSLDTVDWMPTVTEEKILQTVGRAKAGDIVLMHPKANTARALDRMLLDLTARRLQAVTLSELISPDPGAPAGVPQGKH